MLIVKIRDKATEVKITERERGQPKLPTEGRVLPYSRPICCKCGGSKSLGKEHKTDWSSEARSNRVTRVGGASHSTIVYVVLFSLPLKAAISAKH